MTDRISGAISLISIAIAVLVGLPAFPVWPNRYRATPTVARVRRRAAFRDNAAGRQCLAVRIYRRRACADFRRHSQRPHAVAHVRIPVRYNPRNLKAPASLPFVRAG